MKAYCIVLIIHYVFVVLAGFSLYAFQNPWRESGLDYEWLFVAAITAIQAFHMKILSKNLKLKSP